MRPIPRGLTAPVVLVRFQSFSPRRVRNSSTSSCSYFQRRSALVLLAASSVVQSTSLRRAPDVETPRPADEARRMPSSSTDCASPRDMTDMPREPFAERERHVGRQ